MPPSLTLVCQQHPPALLLLCSVLQVLPAELSAGVAALGVRPTAAQLLSVQRV